jgi:hypothetical protein
MASTAGDVAAAETEEPSKQSSGGDGGVGGPETAAATEPAPTVKTEKPHTIKRKRRRPLNPWKVSRLIDLV